jgi:hypothetical protein
MTGGAIVEHDRGASSAGLGTAQARARLDTNKSTQRCNENDMVKVDRRDEWILQRKIPEVCTKLEKYIALMQEEKAVTITKGQQALK